MKEFTMKKSEMSSYLPTSLHKKKEKEIIHDQFLGQNEKHDWHIGREPLSEFSVQYLAAMSFPTLFPDGKGDPTNNATLLNTSDSVTDAFANKLKHLMKFGEKKMENGYTGLHHTQGLDIGLTICYIADEF